MNPSHRLTLWELVLLLASVLVFRSTWYFLDQMSWANGELGMTLLLGIGLVLTVVALRKIHAKP